MKRGKITADKGGIFNILLHSIKGVKLKASNTINSDESAVQSIEFNPSDTVKKTLKQKNLWKTIKFNCTIEIIISRHV